MLYDLLRFDLEGWQPRNDIPKIQAYRDQMVVSLNGKQQWWLGDIDDLGNRLERDLERTRNPQLNGNIIDLTPNPEPKE
jgi:hypothetical protein